MSTESSKQSAVPSNALSRRGFLSRSAATLAGSAAFGTVSTPIAVPAELPERPHKQGAPLRPYGAPSPYERGVVRVATMLTPTELSSWNFTPLQDLHGIITPNGLFFERNHGGVPSIDPREHRLLIEGLVDNPRLFTMDGIKRYPAVSALHFMECSGNTLTEWAKPTGTSVQITHGLLSCCEWTGVRASTVLKDVGVKGGAKWVLAEGADAALMDRSIPLEKLMDDAILAYAQNGEALRPEQGYPLRLVLPGFEGNMNIKWLRRLKVGTEPFYTREETSKYTDLLPNGKARMFTFVMEAKSVITRPSAGMQLMGKGYHEITGLAWSGRGKVTSVEVSTDAEKTWNRASLQEPILTKCLVRFRYPWNWTGDEAVLQSRCYDETGYVQPTLAELVRVRGTNSIYHLNAIQSWHVGRLARRRQRSTRQRFGGARAARVRRRLCDVSWRERPRWPDGSPRRRHRNPEHEEAGQDGRKLLAVRHDRLRLRPPGNAVQSARHAHQRPGLRRNGVPPASQRHRRTDCGDGCKDAAQRENAQ
jgi:sulfane dehydrogenase subunit SoxC